MSSVQNMFKKAGASSVITNDPLVIERASKLLLPGVGAFDNCMQKLDDSGLRGLLGKKVLEEKTPLLGICVGLQMLMESSEEGKLNGLGWIKGKVSQFDKTQMAENPKIPNMGWLDVKVKKQSGLMNTLEGARFYFVHSYHVNVSNPHDELISAMYGYEFTAGIERENIMGVQFHPEKSHRFGMQLLKNFAEKY